MKYINNNLEDSQQTPMSINSPTTINIPSSKNVNENNIVNTESIKEKLSDEITQKTTTPKNLLIENITDVILEEIKNKTQPKTSRKDF